MPKTIITCDSTADLTPELYAKHDINVIALSLTLGDELRRDGLDVTCKDVFDFVDASGMLPKTSAVSVGEYEDVFRPYVEQGYEVLHINLSSQLSASHQNARLAAEEVGNVWVVDSYSLSSGTGHLVLMAREMIDSGMSAAEAAAE